MPQTSTYMDRRGRAWTVTLHRRGSAWQGLASRAWDSNPDRHTTATTRYQVTRAAAEAEARMMADRAACGEPLA